MMCAARFTFTQYETYVAFMSTRPNLVRRYSDNVSNSLQTIYIMQEKDSVEVISISTVSCI